MIPCRWTARILVLLEGLDLPLESSDFMPLEGRDLLLSEGRDLVPLEARAFAAKSRSRNEYQFIPSSSNDSPINLLSVEGPS